MRGPTPLWWAAVLFLVTSSGCLEEVDGLDSQSLSLEGTWVVQAVEREHGCPELGSLPPVGPGAVVFSRQGDTWSVNHANGTATVLYHELEPSVWGRSVSGSLEGCDLRAESTWVFDRIIESRFSATYSAVLTLSGASCPLADESCTVDYALSGLRRQ